MLHQVRSALKGVVAWFVIILLVLAFALWQVPGLDQFSQGSALRVGDVAFSTNAISNEFTRQFGARQRESNGEFTREQAIASGLPDQVIDSLATRSAIEQEAARMGLVMPTSLVKKFLDDDERFQNPNTGKFDSTVLQSILQANGLSVTQFNNIYREDLLRNQLIEAVASGGPAPSKFVELLLLRETEERVVHYLLVTNEMSGAPGEPTPDDLQTFYDSNPVQFTAPEYRTMTAVVLKQADFSDADGTPEADLRKLYDTQKARLYETPELRTIYQITYDSEAEAQAAVASLALGSPFEKLATDQRLTLEAVTFTDVQQRDLLDPSVAEAAFDTNLAIGEVAGPVKSLFGWTVFQLVGMTPPETREFEEVREELAAKYVEEDARRRLYDAVEEIESQRDTGASLATAAETAGVELVNFGPSDKFSFGPGGAIIDGLPGDVIAEAFLLEEGEESESLELSSRDGYYFVAVDSITPPTLRPFDDVRDAAETMWRREEMQARISNTVKTVRQTVEEGKTLGEAGAMFDRAPATETINRGYANEFISAAMTDQIFHADKGALVSGPAGFGDANIVALVDDILLTPDSGSALMSSYREMAGYQLNQELLQAYVEAVRDDIGVTVDNEAVARIFSE